MEKPRNQELTYACKSYPNVQWSVIFPTIWEPPLPKLNDSNINYNLRNLETDLALSEGQRLISSNVSFKYSGAILWNSLSYEAKTSHNYCFPNLKAKLSVCPPLDHSWFRNLYDRVNIFNSIISIILQNSHQYFVKLAV